MVEQTEEPGSDEILDEQGALEKAKADADLAAAEETEEDRRTEAAPPAQDEPEDPDIPEDDDPEPEDER